MKIAGRCHCGNISFEFDAPGELKGSLAATVREESIYRFGTGDFHVCTRCGAVPFVTSEIDGRIYAVVNVNTFEGLDPKTLPRVPVSFDGESTENRLARRKQRWIASVTIRRP